MTVIKRPAIRTCVVCRARKPKQSLVRLVLDTDGFVLLDTDGKRQGRGAYVCREDCTDRGLDRVHLENALRTKLNDQQWVMLHKIFNDDGLL